MISNKLDLSEPEIICNIEAFPKSLKRESRDTSFDYCYNYFRQFAEQKANQLFEKENLETACLQLGFYLASWGMMRNSGLRDLSFPGLEPVIRTIAHAPEEIWSIDLNSYTAEKIEVVCNVGKLIEESFPFETQVPSSTLVTKTMLGVFGCVPAFDMYFGYGSGLHKLGETSLKKIKKFYDTNGKIIDKYHRNRNTIDSKSGDKTENLYSRAKIVDMIFFEEGNKVLRERKNKR